MDIRKQINQQLNEVEDAHEVRILYACESGSRAWGFASEDSDYDVRFIYVPTHYHAYLTTGIEKRRDVIERPLRDNIDLSGWDLRKALGLLYKSNPPLLEWLGSPTVYRAHFRYVNMLRSFVTTYYSPAACQYHYLHMAKGNWHDFIKDRESVLLKKYLYVLRPLLAVEWITKGLGVVPMAFDRLVDSVLKPTPIKQAVIDLAKAKRNGDELGKGERIPLIDEYLRLTFEAYEGVRFNKKTRAPVDMLDAYFQMVAVGITLE